MEPNSPIEVLEAQIRECFGRVVWNHKTHEKCADILTDKNNIIKNTQIILSAFITTGLLVRIFHKQDTKSIISGETALMISTVLSAILFAFNSYLKEYNLAEVIQKHITTATELLIIREKYLSLLTDIKANTLTIAEIIEQRNLLQTKLENTYKGSPRTFSKAYQQASDGLKKNEEYTFSDEEIDKFLPKEIKKLPNS